MSADDDRVDDPVRRLFAASTPMIALSCAAAALAHGGRARLLLIEDFDRADRLQELLQSWRNNPFEAIERLPGRHTEHLQGAPDRARGVQAFVRRTRVKRGLRRQTLAAIRQVERTFAPQEIWLGNDRKPETQLSLHLASTRLGRPVGRYLDDGLYTYLGDVRQRPVIRRIDAMVKRLAYGRWWQRAERAGGTTWITERWLAFPELDGASIASVRPLPRDWFVHRAFLRLALLAAREFGLKRRALAGIGLVLVLPHSNQLRANPALAQRLRELIRIHVGQGERVGVKYHPREHETDPAALLDGEVAVALPGLLPLELLLPLLPAGVRLLGEGSTALLAAHWLRPDLDVADLGISLDGYARRARELFARQGIPTLS